jgi:hypothetical protein
MKRSSQVALLLMGVTGVGASSYALTSRGECPPPTLPGAAAPIQGELTSPACQSRRSYFTSHGSGGHWSRSIFSSGTLSEPSTARGGFGSTGHAASSGS